MSESGDYDPGPWRGHDFTAARKHFDVHAGRSYSAAVSKGTKAKDLVPVNLSTNSPSPLILLCDVTGSMKTSPKFFFSKAPYVDLEGQTYLGKEMETSFAAVGDAYTDSYPLQVRPFVKGLDIKKKIEDLVLEGGGGGQITESYELAALYYARNVSMPNATNPILIFIGDEAPKESVDVYQAKDYAKVDLKHSISTKEVFKELKEKYAVYFIQRPYSKDVEGDVGNEHEIEAEAKMDSTSREVHQAWAKLVGEDHIAYLPRMARVVDVIFGILAKETGKVGYFKEEITGRQKELQVKTAYKSLETIHAGVPALDLAALPPGRSVMLGGNDGTKTKSLLD